MSNGSEDKPLAKWTTGNLIGLLGFIGLIVSAWINLNGRVTALESDGKHIDRQVDNIDRKLDRLLERESK